MTDFNISEKVKRFAQAVRHNFDVAYDARFGEEDRRREAYRQNEQARSERTRLAVVEYMRKQENKS